MNNFLICLLFILIIILSLVCINFKSYYFIKNGGHDKLQNSKLKLQNSKLKLQNDKLQNDKKLTYSISGNDGLDYSVLRQLLNDHSFVECVTTTPYVDLSWGIVDVINITNYKNEFYTQKANLKSIFTALDTNKFTQKDLLPMTAKKYNINLLQFLPESKLLIDVKSTNNKILIVKAGISFGQKGVQIITNDKELYNAKKRFNPQYTIVSTYIRNPLLWKGKKFHLRPFILVYYDGKQIHCFHKIYHRVLTAHQEYKQSDWLNTDIHISGGKNTSEMIKWPDDFNLSKEMLATCNHSLNSCIKEICKMIEKILPKPYPESTSAFELFGPDIMLDETGHAWLLEINKKCGFGRLNNDNLELWDEYNKKLSQEFFSWILDTVVFKHFNVVATGRPTGLIV